MLNIGGFVPLTSIDYPRHLSAVVYCQGCPLQCAYCHNTHLRLAKGVGQHAWEDILRFLDTRLGFLDAVVFSGGEPLVQRRLFEAAQQVKEKGFLVGLHTTGIYPSRLDKVLPFLDWVGFDIKAPFSEYETITKVPGSGDRAKRSLAAILESGVAYECRTTVHSKLLSESKLKQIADELCELGVKNYTVQTFRDEGCQDSELTMKNDVSLSKGVLSELSLKFENFLVT